VIRRRFLLALVALATSAPGATAAPAQAAPPVHAPRASLTDIENDVMCVACKEPLAVAQSPQADSERAYIRTLIAQGQTKPQIERTLVGQYGPAVLGKPPATGFNLTVYILPPAIVAAGLVILAVALPRWRRRTRAQVEAAGAPPPTESSLNPGEAERLDRELTHFDG
jgi:cytochrome c-type biogenesis protein CcmH